MTRIYKLSNGVNLMEEIGRIARKEKIRAAAVAGIGMVNELKLSLSEDPSKKGQVREFREQMEVTTLLGNVRLKGGEPIVHIHPRLAGET